MSAFQQLYDFITIYFNLIEHADFGRMVRDYYANGLGQEVVVEVWDGKPAVIIRDGLEPVYEGGDEGHAQKTQATA